MSPTCPGHRQCYQRYTDKEQAPAESKGEEKESTETSTVPISDEPSQQNGLSNYMFSLELRRRRGYDLSVEKQRN